MSNGCHTAVSVDTSVIDALYGEGGSASRPARCRAVQHQGMADRRWTGSPHAVLTLPSRDTYVRACRGFATQVLRRWGVSEAARDSAVLVIDELAVNAVQHGHADTTVLLARAGDMLLISVTDSGAVVPHSLEGVDSDEHGRGMGIVEFLTEWSEVRHTAAGRRVRVGLRIVGQ